MGRQGRKRYLVGPVSELAPGQSRKFMLRIAGVDEECFLINVDGRLHAYVNRCRHIPLPMDWVDNQFFTEDCSYLMCQTHGALFVPETGECVAGPGNSCGKRLFRVPLEVEGGLIYALPPAVAPEPGLEPS